MAGKSPYPPGYTGVRAQRPDAPYEQYFEDLAAISSSLNSGISGPAVFPTPTESSTHATMRATAKVWQEGFQPDRTFHTQASPEKSLIEAELKRRNIDRTRKEGLGQTGKP
jgi:hypothetical protein